MPFEVGRAGLVPVVRGTDLVRGQRIQQVALAVQHPGVRPEELVRGAHHEIRIDRVHVHRSVRREMHGIDVRERADPVRPEDDVRDPGDRPDRVRSPAERDELRLRPEGVVQGGEVQRGVVGPDVDGLDRQPPILRHQQPWIDVGLVVEGRDDDLVAGRQRRADRPAEVERQRGHVGAELDRLGIGGAEQVGHRNVRLVSDRVVALTGRERAAGIRVRLAVVRGNGLDDRVGDLGPAGSVEEHERPPVVKLTQGREAAAHRLDVEVDHRTVPSAWRIGRAGCADAIPDGDGPDDGLRK